MSAASDESLQAERFPARTPSITSVLVAAAIVAGVVLAWEIILILFLGILFAVFLDRLSGWLATRLPVPRPVCLGGVVLLLLTCVVGGTMSFFVQINQQVQDASSQIDEGVAELRELIGSYPAAESFVDRIPFVSDALIESDDTKQEPNAAGDSDRGPLTSVAEVPQPVRSAARSLGALFQTTFGLAINSLLIFFVGLFLAASPELYRDGAIRLIAPERRERIAEVLDAVGESLWKWLVGRFGSMLITGLGAFLVLMAIGVPMAGMLGIVTALLTFVPNIGSAVALMLAMLFALPQGASPVLIVLIAYLSLQLVESYVISPLIQRHHASLPPALLISSQAVMGVLFGFLGAAVASPLLAATKKSVEMLYIHDVLENATDSA